MIRVTSDLGSSWWFLYRRSRLEEGVCFRVKVLGNPQRVLFHSRRSTCVSATALTQHSGAFGKSRPFRNIIYSHLWKYGVALFSSWINLRSHRSRLQCGLYLFIPMFVPNLVSSITDCAQSYASSTVLYLLFPFIVSPGIAGGSQSEDGSFFVCCRAPPPFLTF